MLDWTVGKVLEWSATYLKKNEIDAPKRTAELLLGHSLAMSRVDLYLRYQKPLTAEELAGYKALLKRRTSREPTQYILGTQEFWSLTFAVDPRVLIPRPETECLVEEACRRLRASVSGEIEFSEAFTSTRPKKVLRWNEQQPDLSARSKEASHTNTAEQAEASDENAGIEQAEASDENAGIEQAEASDENAGIEQAEASDENAGIEQAEASEQIESSKEKESRVRLKEWRFLDLCTGSGALACALASEFPRATVWASDISVGALEVARKNIEALGFSQRIRLVEGDLWSSVEGQSFDLIVSNPPYIRRDEMAGLQREVRDYEPHLALEAGEDGLDIVRRIVREAPRFLKPQGWLLVEIGSQQGQAALSLFGSDKAYQSIVLGQDYARLDRYVAAQRAVDLC
ncbi:peptide chain release factor N(5)-glutamine methyltransferase [Myxococcota bacterium]|nr:peptide chain release factor N(5)-glutamine methyltransferase [Myxococcota bacterium]